MGAAAFWGIGALLALSVLAATRHDAVAAPWVLVLGVALNLWFAANVPSWWALLLWDGSESVAVLLLAGGLQLLMPLAA